MTLRNLSRRVFLSSQCMTNIFLYRAGRIYVHDLEPVVFHVYILFCFGIFFAKFLEKERKSRIFVLEIETTWNSVSTLSVLNRTRSSSFSRQSHNESRLFVFSGTRTTLVFGVVIDI